jgi:hypothetical protein
VSDGERLNLLRHVLSQLSRRASAFLQIGQPRLTAFCVTSSSTAGSCTSKQRVGRCENRWSVS